MTSIRNTIAGKTLRIRDLADGRLTAVYWESRCLLVFCALIGVILNLISLYFGALILLFFVRFGFGASPFFVPAGAVVLLFLFVVTSWALFHLFRDWSLRLELTLTDEDWSCARG